MNLRESKISNSS